MAESASQGANIKIREASTRVSKLRRSLSLSLSLCLCSPRVSRRGSKAKGRVCAFSSSSQAWEDRKGQGSLPFLSDCCPGRGGQRKIPGFVFVFPGSLLHRIMIGRHTNSRANILLSTLYTIFSVTHYLDLHASTDFFCYLSNIFLPSKAINVL
jgi:hypothetical protein